VDAPYDAVVLAGGSGRRLGGVDKPGLVVGGRTLLEGVLAAVADACRVVVVGPPRELGDRFVQVREEPPGGGPAAALAAGLLHVEAPWTAVLAADLPDLDAPTVLALRRAAAGRDGALLVDDEGRDQVLTGVWSTPLLQAATAGRELAGARLRVLLDGLAPARVTAASLGLHGWGDCDTPADLARARGSEPR
jgi:molybdopterin-guanine dinucleotide biosynthesis protein A